MALNLRALEEADWRAFRDLRLHALRSEPGVFASSYAWLRERPRYKRVVVSHRRSNEPSRRANQRFGFHPVGSVPTRWPDGTDDDELMYELSLEKVPPP